MLKLTALAYLSGLTGVGATRGTASDDEAQPIVLGEMRWNKKVEKRFGSDTCQTPENRIVV